MSDAFADGRTAGDAAGRLVRIVVVFAAAIAIVVVMMMVVVVMVVMIVVVMMTAGADFLRFRGGSIEFQFFSHYFFSAPEPDPAPAGADAARCCRGS